VILPARVAILCPEECRCETGGYYVVCDETPITAVPIIQLPDVRGICLYYNKISLLHNNSFVSVTELEILDIVSCGLRTVELGAFNGLSKLRRLIIQGNELSEVIPGIFENTISLENIDLHNNRIEHVDRNLFSGLFKLKHLDLSQNKLLYFHPDTILMLPNIETLNLGENHGLKIPTDRNFINSISLSQLNISHCNISSVTVETFANFSQLKELSMHHNKLNTVDIKILRKLPKLSEMYLNGNPLQCDCQLKEVWRWCEEHNVSTRHGKTPPECNAPRKVMGIWWGVLEKGQCLENAIVYDEDYSITSYSYNDIDHKYLYGFDVENFKQYEIPLYAVPFVFGITSNIILLVIIICNKDMRTLPNMYILNLAISDIIFLTILFSEAYANRMYDTWLDGDLVCTLLPFCRRLSIGLSAYSVAVFSIQRYRATLNPFKVLASSETTWRVTVATICGVWIVAALFAIPSALSRYMCRALFILERINYYQDVVIFELLVSCVLPLCVIAFSYIMTARHLVESSRNICERTQNSQLKTRRNSAKIVVGLTFVFLASYVPYHVFWIYIIWTEDEKVFVLKFSDILDYWNYKLRYTYLISTCLLLINSCLNPVALFCTSSPFRQHLKRYLCCFCKTNSPPTDLKLQRRD
jgi:hypothetical protein